MRQMEVLRTSERNKRISNQAVVIRTVGEPTLLRRNLTALKRGIDTTRATTSITVGIVDDSQDEPTRMANRRAMAEVGLDGFYVSTQEIENDSILTKIRKRAVTLAQRRGIPEAEVLQAYQYLLTEQKDINHPIFSSDMSVGRGSNATCNVATLMGAYMLGASKTPETEGVITHYDNDVIPGLSLTRENGIPSFFTFDQFAARDEKFANADTLLSAGKYAGIAGDPFGTAEIALRVTSGILADYQTGNHDEMSPYTVYDASSHTFLQITKAEAFQRLPEIIHSFLIRAPITGFLTREDLNFDSATIKHDGGNWTHRDTLARRVPSAPTGVHEFSILAPTKVLYSYVPMESLIQVEEPAMHIREDLPTDIDIHQGGLLSGTHGRIIQHQILLELALQQRPDLVSEILHALGQEQVAANAIDALPKLNTGANIAATIGVGEPVTKNQRLARVRELRDTIARQTSNLANNAGSIKKSIGLLTQEFNETALSDIEHALSPNQNAADIRKMIAALEKYYIPALIVWPTLYDAAYQIGLEDAA